MIKHDVGGKCKLSNILFTSEDMQSRRIILPNLMPWETSMKCQVALIFDRLSFSVSDGGIPLLMYDYVSVKIIKLYSQL